MKKTVISVLSVVLGNFIYALTVALFLLPSGLVTGGTTGIALVAYELWEIPVSAFVFLFNLLMLLIGYFFIGAQFALSTVASTFLYPLFLELCTRLFGDAAPTGDILLCAVYTGLGIGIALGMVIRAGASTGGMDIPPLVLNKYFKLPVSLGLYAFDFVILLLQAIVFPIENILYGILLVIIYTVVLDKVILLGSSKTEIKIISEKHREISELILSKIDRGVTLLKSEGGYLHEEGRLVLSVVSNRELIKVERLAREIDPECFMIVSRVNEVSGRGFSIKKHYK